MTQLIRQGYVFVILCLAGRTESACRSLYPDLCGYDGNDAAETEVHNDVHICDCQQVMFCSVVELTEECNTATVSFRTSDNISSCDLSPLKSEANIPVYKILKITENEFSVEIFTEFYFGKYRITCNTIETASEVNNTQWDIISVDPMEVTIDSEVQVTLTVAGEPQVDSTPVWCFVKTPDGDIQILSSYWLSDGQIDCMGFSAGVPGVFLISAGLAMTPDVFEKVISITATAKRPVVKEAKYSYSFDAIFVCFDENVELRSTCGSVFPEGSHQYFGVGFYCHTQGDTLIIKMGTSNKILADLTITGVGAICAAASQTSEFCLEPVSIPVSKPKISDPSLSFQVEASCGVTTKKYMSVKTSPSNRVNPTSQYPRAPHKRSGKGQRRNLMAWRMMRQFQRKLSNRHVVVLLNTTDVHPLLNSLPSVENLLDFNDNLSSAATVSVVAHSSPAIVLAEAHVTFCKDSAKSFRYKWMLNGQDVFQDGKMLILKDLAPGKYALKCLAVDCNSTEVFGQGWATAEVLAGEEKIVIVPSEITAGTADDFSLRAVTWHGSSVSWTCKVSGDRLCLTADGKSVGDVINLHSPNVTVPAGTLPVGVYVWTAGSARGSNEARVVVTDGNAATVGLEIPSVFISPSQEVVMRGIVGRTQRGCRAWWSSLRQKGFDYFHIDTVEINADIPGIDIPLAIPPDSEMWKKAVPNSMYLFQLQVFCPSSSNNEKGSLESLKVPLIVSKPPRVTQLTVHPLKGDAMITSFTVNTTEADTSPDDLPLTYEWSYVDSCDTEVAITRGTFPRELTTYLPPGDLKLSLRICNVRGSCSTTSSPPISVTQAFEFPADNFHNARNQIQRLMTRGDTLEAFGLATTVFKSLALLAEGEVREAVYSTVEEGIKVKIDELRRKVQSNGKGLEESLEFLERAVTVAGYLRKGSDTLKRLMQFKKSILKNGKS